MEGKRLIEKLRLRNILSFGDKGEEIELLPLNVIIGQNASGKSNLVDVIKLLRSLTRENGFANFISRNGGINEWIWKGKNTGFSKIEVWTLDYIDPSHYEINFEDLNQRSNVAKEIIENTENNSSYSKKRSSSDSFFSNILPEFIDKGAYFAYLKTRNLFSILTFFTELQTNRSSEIRKPQLPDAPNNFLEEDASNLALVLNDLEHRGDAKDKIIKNLRKFNPRIKDYSVRILGGTVQLFIREEGLEKPISAMRLSDGTLRYLCLLAILCHPEPPPLICIEEPETGLHPDILPTIAELMKEARHRTQLIVTTHSDILVSAFSEIPEAILVCEKDEDGTHFKRLEKEKLESWLEEYALGEVWLKGEIGGTRW
ncbi:AAA family ATPase [soil metagenome]